LPILHVHILEGRTEERKAELIRELTETTSRVMEVSPASIRVLLSEVPKSHWGIGGTPVSKLPGR
jgi:4-oxalocrotonate tautomerase